MISQTGKISSILVALIIEKEMLPISGWTIIFPLIWTGGVDENSRTWKPTPLMDISDTENVKRDVDYFMMTYEQRAVDMDRLEAPVGHVITGIKLRSLGGHINLEIQVNAYIERAKKL